MSESIENTQPLKPVKKASRWQSVLIGIVGVIVLLALAGFGGYESAIATRTQAKSNWSMSNLMDQYKLALVDEQFKRYDDAKQRLNFIIQNDPSFPGAQTEMTKLLIIMSIPTATADADPHADPRCARPAGDVYHRPAIDRSQQLG